MSGLIFSDTDECTRQKDVASASLDARALDLARNWKPTGYYLVEDMQKVLESTFAVLSASVGGVDAAIAAGAPEGVRAVLHEAQRRIQKKMNEDSVPFRNALIQARQAGVRVVDAPSFKSWVVGSMNAASLAVGAVAYTACLKPAMVKFVQAIYEASLVLVEVGKAMVSATIAAGEAVLKIPSFLSDLWRYGKYLALTVVGISAYVVVKRRLAESAVTESGTRGVRLHRALPPGIREEDVIDV